MYTERNKLVVVANHTLLSLSKKFLVIIKITFMKECSNSEGIKFKMLNVYEALSYKQYKIVL